MSEWSFAIGPPGSITRELNAAQSRSVTFKLSEPSEAQVSLDGWDLAAREIVELATDIYAYRRADTGEPRRLLYRGRIHKVSDEIGESGHEVTVPSVDYRGVLKRRLIMHGFPLPYRVTDIDQMAIAWDLVNRAQTNVSGGNLGITNGLGQTSGKLRTREFELGQPIFDKIQDLSEVIDGFEWDITPTDVNDVLGLQLDRWYPQRGIVKNEVLMYTPQGANVKSVSRQVDSSDFANAVRLTGRAPESDSGSTSTEPAPVERQIAWSPAPPEGRWDKLYTEDITDPTSLAERADWRLADAQLIQPSYTVGLKPGFWRGPDHLWLGDTITLVVQSGRLDVETQLRVLEIKVDIDENGVESVSLTLGYPRKSFSNMMSDIDRRLAKLERR